MCKIAHFVVYTWATLQKPSFYRMFDRLESPKITGGRLAAPVDMFRCRPMDEAFWEQCPEFRIL